MPTYNWRGQTIHAPSQEALKKYISKQHAAGLILDDGDTPETVVERMRPYISDIYDAEDSNGLPRGLLKKILYSESRFRDDIVSGNTRSSAGAVGIAQFMPSTAEELKIDPTDPKQAIPAAGKYLASLKEQTGSWEGAVAAYNWGVGNVKRKGLEQAPDETKQYMVSVLGGDESGD